MFNKDVKKRALDFLSYMSPDSVYGCDLHHEIFNKSSFIVGNHAAEEWLKDNVGIFKARKIIADYEKDALGELYTDLSSAKRVCNMYVYILGEELLNESKTLHENWDILLSAEAIEAIKEELKSL